MPKQIIEFVIDEDGSVEMDASGFTGPACLRATEPFEKALGTVASREAKKEMSQRAVTETKNRSRA